MNPNGLNSRFCGELRKSSRTRKEKQDGRSIWKMGGGGGRFKTSKDQPSDRKDVNQFAYLVRLGLKANWPSLSHVRRVRNFFSPHFSNQLRKWEYAVDISLKSCELQKKNCNGGCSFGATFLWKAAGLESCGQLKVIAIAVVEQHLFSKLQTCSGGSTFFRLHYFIADVKRVALELTNISVKIQKNRFLY
jgi:hypothetical protein